MIDHINIPNDKSCHKCTFSSPSALELSVVVEESSSLSTSCKKACCFCSRCLRASCRNKAFVLFENFPFIAKMKKIINLIYSCYLENIPFIYVWRREKTAPVSGNMNYSKHNLRLNVIIFKLFKICDKWTGNMFLFPIQLTNYNAYRLLSCYLIKTIKKLRVSAII